MREFFELINEYPITSLLVACFIIKLVRVVMGEWNNEELLDDITICDQPPEGFVFVFEIGHDLPVNIPVDKVLNYITEHGKITYNEFIKFSI